MANLKPRLIPIRLPEVGNPTPDPSLHPDRMLSISAAGAEVLISFFHNGPFRVQRDSESCREWIVRSPVFGSCGKEATLSRIFAGCIVPFDLYGRSAVGQ